jgi:hypothetical protein
VILDTETRLPQVVTTTVSDHVDLEAQGASVGQALDLAEVGPRWKVIEVHDRRPVIEVDCFTVSLDRAGHGIDVGHPDDSRVAAGRRGAGPVLDVFLVLVTRLSEVGVGIDHAGEQGQSRHIDRLSGRCGRRVVLESDDLLASDQHVGPDRPLGRYDLPSPEQEVRRLRHAFLLTMWTIE